MHRVCMHTSLSHDERSIRERTRDVRQARREKDSVTSRTPALNPAFDARRRCETKRFRTVDQMNARL